MYFDNMYMYEKYMCLILRDLLTLCNYCMSTTLLFTAKPLSIKFYLGFERLNVQLHDRMDAFTGLCPYYCRVPTRTGKTGKPGKMGRHFPVREKSGNFEQTGKVRENQTKYWKTQEI